VRGLTPFNVRTTNPFKMSAAKRASHMAIAGGKVFCTGNNARHSWGANLVVWDPVRARHTRLRNLVKGYSSRELAVSRDGKYVLFSTGGTEENAPALFIFDALTAEVAKKVDLPLKDAGSWGNIFAVDGNAVVGVIGMDAMLPGEKEKAETIDFYAPKYDHKYRVYKFDYMAEKVLLDRVEEGESFNGPCYWDYKSNARKFCVGPDGCGWFFVDLWLTRIHPDGTVEKVLQMETPGHMFFIGEDLYFYNGGRQNWGGFAGMKRIRKVFAE
jgi:hypothetical protein